jgi:hypothetical protein
MTPRQRFDAKWRLDPETGCWLWTAGCTSGGYGTFGVRVDGRWRMMRAHRIAWQLHVGPIPPGLCALHHCDTPPCVNPQHLFLGTQAENNRDMTAKGRRAPTVGGANPNAALSEAEALSILRLKGSGQRQADVALSFGVTQTQVSRIWLGKAWAHLSGVA